MPHIGTTEFIIILVIVMILFGSSRLPALGQGIGQALRNVKKGLSGEEEKNTPSEKA